MNWLKVCCIFDCFLVFFIIYINFLFTAQRSLRELKSKISAQSKKNFVLERDVRYLDSRIALLIQNRIALDEVI